MLESDFSIYGIKYVTPREVRATGADLADVQTETIIKLNCFRTRLGRAVVLLHGGMTTGKHARPNHKKGYAVDITFREPDGPINVVEIFKTALETGFKAFGVYWNGSAYSFHLEIAKSFAFWYKAKRHRATDWEKTGNLIIDPATIFE